MLKIGVQIPGTESIATMPRVCKDWKIFRALAVEFSYTELPREIYESEVGNSINLGWPK